VSPGASRILTFVAASVLAFDGVALAGLGWWGQRFMLVLLGLVCLVSSGLVLWYWQWYQRRLQDIETAGRALGDEARELQRLLGNQRGERPTG
jgi:hypothetical protein